MTGMDQNSVANRNKSPDSLVESTSSISGWMLSGWTSRPSGQLSSATDTSTGGPDSSSAEGGFL